MTTPAHNLVAAVVSWVGTRAASCPVPLAFTQALAEPSSLCSPLWDRRLQLWLVLPRVVAGQRTYLCCPEPRLIPAMALVKAVSCRLWGQRVPAAGLTCLPGFPQLCRPGLLTVPLWQSAPGLSLGPGPGRLSLAPGTRLPQQARKQAFQAGDHWWR